MRPWDSDTLRNSYLKKLSGLKSAQPIFELVDMQKANLERTIGEFEKLSTKDSLKTFKIIDLFSVS